MEIPESSSTKNELFPCCSLTKGIYLAREMQTIKYQRQGLIIKLNTENMYNIRKIRQAVQRNTRKIKLTQVYA